MNPTIVQVDAFTDTPFRGNPAAVCLTDRRVDEVWMKGLAREMNLSETAFVHPIGDGAYSLRWLTPAVEVDLCGHATLATAHALWELVAIPPDAPARFQTRSGLLTASRGTDGWITLDFPSRPPLRAVDRDESGTIADAIGAAPIACWQNAFDLLAEFESERAVRDLRPDFSALKRLDARGMIATARAATPGVDFVSRFFAPAVGIDEDPVTGSAHCFLGPFWSDRIGETDLIAHQVSDRPGVLRVGVRGDRVLIGGQAVTVLRVELTEAASPPG